MAKLPRGIRNNNPGNLEWGDPWQGLLEPKKRTDKRFAQFEDPVMGIRAIARTLITYQDKYGIKTIEDAIHRWAPPNENDTLSYSSHVARLAEVSPNRSEEHTSELQSLMRNSSAVFCLKKKK